MPEKRFTPTPERAMHTLGVRCRELRKEKGWAMVNLAAEADISETVISNVEGFRRGGIRLAAVLGMADAFGVSIAYLVGETDDRER